MGTLLIGSLFPCHGEPSVPDLKSILMSLGNILHCTILLLGYAISTHQEDISLKYLVWKKITMLIKCSSFLSCVLESIPALFLSRIILCISLSRMQPDFMEQVKRTMLHMCFSLNWVMTPLYRPAQSSVSHLLCTERSNFSLRDVVRII